VNPTDISSEAIVHILIVIKRFFESRGRETQEEEGSGDGPKGTGALDSRVVNWLLVRLCRSSMKYTLYEIVEIIGCGEFLSIMHLDLKTLVIEKVKCVRSKACSLDDLRSILNFLPLLEFESIAYIMEDFLFRAHPRDILGLTQLIERESMSA
jgi:hypothetical protein